jgi:hypothetical protein
MAGKSVKPMEFQHIAGIWGKGGGLYMGMGDLGTGSNQMTASWWVYKRYVYMTGRRVNDTTGSKIDGVATTDSRAVKAIIVLGNRVCVTGAVTVDFNGIPSYMLKNNSMNVLVERMPAGSRYVSAPTVVSDQDIKMSNNSLSLTMNWNSPADAYAITLTPGI